MRANKFIQSFNLQTDPAAFTTSTKHPLALKGRFYPVFSGQFCSQSLRKAPHVTLDPSPQHGPAATRTELSLCQGALERGDVVLVAQHAL